MKDYKKAYKELEKDYKKLVKLYDKYENEHKTEFRYWVISLYELRRENKKLKEVIENQEKEIKDYIKREFELQDKLDNKEEIELL